MRVFHVKYFHVLILPILLLFSGCTYKEAFSPKTREKKALHYTRLGLAMPEKNVTILNDIDPDALGGLGYGARSCARLASTFRYFNSGMEFFVDAVCLPFGVTFGTLSGASESYELERVKEQDGTMQASFEATGIYDRTQQIISVYVKETGLDIASIDTADILKDNNQTVDYASLTSRGIDTVVAFKIDKIELDEKGLGHIPVEIHLRISGKLLNASNGEIIDTDIKEMKSRIHPYEEWVKNDFELLNKEFNDMLENASESIIDELLFLYYPTFSEELSVRERTAPFYVLKAYYPKVTFEHFSKDIINGSSHVFTEIHELQPILHWESFPWDYDAVPKERFEEIVYDLEIYEFKTGGLVYERKGLKTNKHQVEVKLQGETKYLWRVRARFQLDNKPRFTEWSGVYENSWSDIPPWRFGTDTSFCGWGYRELRHKKYFSYAFIIEED